MDAADAVVKGGNGSPVGIQGRIEQVYYLDGINNQRHGKETTSTVQGDRRMQRAGTAAGTDLPASADVWDEADGVPRGHRWGRPLVSPADVVLNWT